MYMNCSYFYILIYIHIVMFIWIYFKVGPYKRKMNLKNAAIKYNMSLIRHFRDLSEQYWFKSGSTTPNMVKNGILAGIRAETFTEVNQEDYLIGYSF